MERYPGALRRGTGRGDPRWRSSPVAGPRQVGKTTFARRLVTPADYFSWDLDAHRKRILRESRFWELQAPGSPRARLRIVLDEIHKYPRWKRLLKGVYDSEGEHLEIIVTGSGRLDIYQKGGDSLVGRYTLARLHPFTLGELLSRSPQVVRAPSTLDRALADVPSFPGAAAALDQLETFSGFPEPLFAAR